jgi:hypothetical protein
MKLFNNLQFGLPKVQGVAPYLDSLFTKAGEITHWMVMPKFTTGKTVPWLLVHWKEENKFTVLGPFSNIEGALLAALRIEEPYVLILHENVTHFELEKLIKSVWIKRKKCAVFALPLEKFDTAEIKSHVGDIPTEAARETARLAVEIKELSL